MTFDEIRFSLGINGVENEDVETLITYCKKQGTHYDQLDDMLVQNNKPHKIYNFMRFTSLKR